MGPLYGGAASVKVVRGARQPGALRLHLDPPRSAKILLLGIARGSGAVQRKPSTSSGTKVKRFHSCQMATNVVSELGVQLDPSGSRPRRKQSIIAIDARPKLSLGEVILTPGAAAARG